MTEYIKWTEKLTAAMNKGEQQLAWRQMRIQAAELFPCSEMSDVLYYTSL
jgi:hypothetical protein